MGRDVVITGLGVVSALGVGRDDFWNGLVEGLSGLKGITRFDASGFPCRVGGEVTDLAVRDYLPKAYRKFTKVMARDIELAVVAAALAVRDAGLRTRVDDEPSIAAGRLGCQIGAGLIAAETAELTRALASSLDEGGSFSLRAWGTAEGPDGEPGGGGMDNLPPLWLLKYLPNMLACHVTILHGAEGPSNTITCSEASALLSLGESARVIGRDDADVCFSGGAESKLNYMSMVRMDYAGRLAHTDEAEDGSRVVRPYANESGGVLGEAGAVLMLEEASHARARGAEAYARVSGFGAAQSIRPLLNTGLSGADGSETDSGLSDAIEAALSDARLGASQIDAIVPLGLGVPKLDQIEAGAMRRVFGERLGEIPLVTLTPNVGNCSAAQGGLMAAAAAMAIRRQAVPARLNSGSIVSGLNAGPAAVQSRAIRNVLVCAAALGGQCAALVLSKP